MITVTDVAAQKIKSMLENENKLGWSLRVGVLGGGCSGFQYNLVFEEKPEENDQRFISKNILLHVDFKSCLYLNGVEIDYVDGLMGSGFKVNNPNAVTTCGCGESFSA